MRSLGTHRDRSAKRRTESSKSDGKAGRLQLVRPNLRRFYSRQSSGLTWFRIIVGLRAGAEGEGKISDNDPAAGPDPHVNFDAPAILRKWPSLNNQRRADGAGPYLLFDGVLDECIRKFMSNPARVRHLYVISHFTTATFGGRHII